MKRVYIVVEGQTEQSFVNEVLFPHFLEHDIYQVTPLLIHTSKTGRGGFVNYQHLKNTILPKLKEESSKDIVVTMLVDFFRIPTNLPNYDLAMRKSNRIEQVEALEQGITHDIGDSRFFSYIQLHEFEALLFSNSRGFNNFCGDEEARYFEELINNFDNPEDINTTPQGAPSKRIIAMIPHYDKVIEGNVLALEVGLRSILEKCPRFKRWVDEIISRAKD